MRADFIYKAHICAIYFNQMAEKNIKFNRRKQIIRLFFSRGLNKTKLQQMCENYGINY